MADEYLHKSLILYQKIYGKQHLKTALCLTQLGLMHLQFGKNLFDSTRYYLRLADNIFHAKPLTTSFSAECDYGLSNIEHLKWDNEKALLHINKALSLLESKHRDKEILYALCLSWKSLVVRKEGSMHPEKKVNISDKWILLFTKPLMWVKKRLLINCKKYMRIIFG
ncbi:MAG: tetratricopeptide repeat protein [Saprospiraceae bacterium]|nr:tetratricopeptide repeat protein [Saprospiraceae bacterium]